MKGQIIAHLTEKLPERFYAVRVGGPNAGHTAIARDGQPIKAQTIPIPAFINPRCVPVLGCSAVILPELLDAELQRLSAVWSGKSHGLPVIDRQAVVITKAMMDAEIEMKTRIGSTGEGVGAATAAKVMRTGVTFENWLSSDPDGIAFGRIWGKRIEVLDTVRMLQGCLASQMPLQVYLEGTQGYQLSLNVSGYYPFCTSRDCGPDALMSQVGVSARSFGNSEVIGVFRTFPIRVGGNSGPLPKETTWDDMQRRTNGYIKEPERTTVTKKIRRIAEWDWDTALATVAETRPTHLAITFLDYVYPEVNACTKREELPAKAMQYLETIQNRLNVPVRYVSVGAGQANTFTLHV